MTSQRDMVRASLEAEHDHGTYCRRKAERRDGDRRDPATTVTVDRERLERVAGLLAKAERYHPSQNDEGFLAVDEEIVDDALAELRSILGGDGSTVRP